MATHEIKVLKPKDGSHVFESSQEVLKWDVKSRDEIKISLKTIGQTTGKATIWFIPNAPETRTYTTNGSYSLASGGVFKRKDNYLLLDIDEKGMALTVNQLPKDFPELRYSLKVTSSENDNPKSNGGGDGAVASLRVSTG